MSLDLLALFARDGRPDVIMSFEDFKAGKFDCNTAYLLHGKFDDAIGIANYADLLAYGTVLLIYGFPDEEYAAFNKVIHSEYDFCAWDKFGEDQGARAWVKSHYDGGTFATHLPYLLEAVKQTTGSVIELGSGDGSTPALHEICAKTHRMLITVDSDMEWLKRYEALRSDGHRLELEKDPAKSRWIVEKINRWGVVFVDHSPGETRRNAIELVRDCADFVVVHDTEELGYGMEPVLASFRYRKDFKYARPWTTVVSMTREIFSDPRSVP